MPGHHPSSPPLSRRFVGVWSVGLVGVLALAWQPVPTEFPAKAPEFANLSPVAIKALLLVNPLVLLTLAAFVGALLAHRVGLVSWLAGTLRSGADPRHMRGFVHAAGAGLLVAALLVAADLLLAPWLGAEWAALQRQADAAPEASTLALGVLYGGLAEEVMMRWGLMSVVLFTMTRVSMRIGGTRPLHADGRATPVFAWIAIVAAALAFAAGHLPALAQSIELTPAVAFRTVVLNAAAGCVYGWVFWRSGLEASMASHASTHVGFALARIAL